ncbi:Ff.00g009440.m01.CDS01 [Fusarium sp. VM40]|nr:Ff.00g009440.m01.CDS01 [Fusarium sp. VM40]
MELDHRPPLDYVTVKTTLPFYPLPPNGDRKPFRTERLSMRPMTEDDLEFLNALRSEPEGMIWSSQGCADKDIEQTKKSHALRMPPNDVKGYDWVVCLPETGEPIGMGGTGMWSGELGWPAVGYQFLKAHWGKGYASEFLKGFLGQWWSLPRNEVEISVDKNTIRGDGDGDVKEECVSAITVDSHSASQKVLKKCGMEFATAWTETDVRDRTQEVTLHGFFVRKGKDV